MKTNKCRLQAESNSKDSAIFESTKQYQYFLKAPHIILTPAIFSYGKAAPEIAPSVRKIPAEGDRSSCGRIGPVEQESIVTRSPEAGREYTLANGISRERRGKYQIHERSETQAHLNPRTN